MSAALEYDAGDVAEPRDHSSDPSRTSLLRAFGRVDMVGMNIERRHWEADIAVGNIIAIQLYTDASPVTGAEMQGSVVDVCMIPTEGRRLILPGQTLTYTNFNAVSKTVALLFASWLCFGPSQDSMDCFLDLVAAITIDSGTEVRTLEVPYFLHALLAWISGRPLDERRRFVEHDRRLFRRALRIAGWGHTMGNIMKELMRRFASWPELLDYMRAVAKFLRNETWRLHLVRKLSNVYPGDLKALLRSFQIKLLKWRYETIAELLASLGPLRLLFESYICEGLFDMTQDPEPLKQVLAAAKDKFLWKFIGNVNAYVLVHLEGMRRWSLVCPCPEHRAARRAGQKNIKCFANGRRLDEAFEYAMKMASNFRDWARGLRVEDVEDDYRLYNCIKNYLMAAADLVTMRFKYLGFIPWFFVKMSLPGYCVQIVVQWRSKPREAHDDLSREIWDTMGVDIEACAEGSPPSAQMLKEV